VGQKARSQNWPSHFLQLRKPYEFRWIDNIGTNIIKNVTLTIGGQIVQTFNGEYIRNLVDRDFKLVKKETIALINELKCVLKSIEEDDF
jgi:hypothetical protein